MMRTSTIATLHFSKLVRFIGIWGYIHACVWLCNKSQIKCVNTFGDQKYSQKKQYKNSNVSQNKQ